MSKTGTDTYRVVFVKLKPRNSSGGFSRGLPTERLSGAEPTLLNRDQLDLIDSFNYTPYRLGLASKDLDLTEKIRTLEDEVYDGGGSDGRQTQYTAIRRLTHTINCVKGEHVLIPEQFSVNNSANILANAEISSLSVSDKKDEVELKYLPHFSTLSSNSGEHFITIEVENSQDRIIPTTDRWAFQLLDPSVGVIKFDFPRVYYTVAETALRLTALYRINSDGSVGMSVLRHTDVVEETRKRVALLNGVGAIIFENLGITPLELKSYETETKIPARVRSFSIKTTKLTTEASDLITNSENVLGDVGFYIVKEGVDPFTLDGLGNRYLDVSKVRDYGYLLSSTQTDDGNFTFQGSRTLLTKAPNLLKDLTVNTEGDDLWEDPDDGDDGDDGGDGGDGDEPDTYEDLETLSRLAGRIFSNVHNYGEILHPYINYAKPTLTVTGDEEITFETDLDADASPPTIKGTKISVVSRTLPLGYYTVMFKLQITEFVPRETPAITEDSGLVEVVFGDIWGSDEATRDSVKVAIPIGAEAIRNRDWQVKTVCNLHVTKSTLTDRFGFYVLMGVGHGMTLKISDVEFETLPLRGGGGRPSEP